MLTARQRAFVESYKGNATEAAIAAGYSAKTAYSQGGRLLKNAEVSQAIQERESKEASARVATREERQAFWTDIMRDGEATMKDRLRASELLGKAAGDFLERVEVESNENLTLRMEVRMALLERERKRRQGEEGLEALS